MCVCVCGKINRRIETVETLVATNAPVQMGNSLTKHFVNIKYHMNKTSVIPYVMTKHLVKISSHTHTHTHTHSDSHNMIGTQKKKKKKKKKTRLQTGAS